MMSKPKPHTPEQLGIALHDYLGGFLETELPKLKKTLELDQRSSDEQIKGEWELTVFITFCVVQSVAHEVEDDTRRQDILTAFFKAAAGKDNLREMLAAMQPRFEEYEQALFNLKPDQIAFEAAGMLNDRMFPNQPSAGAKMEALAKLFPTMSEACLKILESA
jgi:hypothetical protein